MSIEKLRMYKTAFSYLYETYIEIMEVDLDKNGEPIILGRPAFTDKKVLFRVCELKEFCL